MTEKRDVTARGLSKGDEVRLIRPAKFQTLHNGWGVLPIDTRGVVTSVGEAGLPVFAKIGGYEMELLPGEYERV